MFSFYVIYYDTWRVNNIKFIRSFVRSFARSFVRSLTLDLRAPIKEGDDIGGIGASHGIIWDILRIT